MCVLGRYRFCARPSLGRANHGLRYLGLCFWWCAHHEAFWPVSQFLNSQWGVMPVPPSHCIPCIIFSQSLALGVMPVLPKSGSAASLMAVGAAAPLTAVLFSQPFGISNRFSSVLVEGAVMLFKLAVFAAPCTAEVLVRGSSSWTVGGEYDVLLLGAYSECVDCGVKPVELCREIGSLMSEMSLPKACTLAAMPLLMMGLRPTGAGLFMLLISASRDACIADWLADQPHVASPGRMPWMP